MRVLASERAEIRAEDDVVRVRHLVRTWATRTGLSLVDQTKLITAASELARNTLIYGGGGHLEVETVEAPDGRTGLRLAFVDQGPGIADVALALTDGYTTGSGLGLGLSGSRRLVNEFTIDSRVGVGTRVSIVKWK